MTEDAAVAKRLFDAERWAHASRALVRVAGGATGDDAGNRQIAEYHLAIAFYRLENRTAAADLFVADPGEALGIVAAALHGDLPGIVCVAAARTALNLRRKDHRLELDDDRLVTELCPDAAPELATLKEQHRAAFKAALEDALSALCAQERTVLRMHLSHGRSIDAIGSSFRVHRATAARWLGSIRSKLHRETRRLLREREGLTDQEFDSLVRLVESRIQVSFRRVLESAAGG